ncbi:nucleotide-binding universal stress UspA family protein [Methanolinea mesophila]|uniref:universal stress protein n=1 Tax=Methanolinea mesophila TaxID=547055 RepID=UPI001AEA5B9B|nr:universal stress protein [Methanolinea mesophila]MBP1927922.1 nucleotide-binding universal stress UspA family protein [Methanolinea mesophila]
MYSDIAIAVDKSPCSHASETIGVEIAKQFHAAVSGYHVYSGRFHRARFGALEPYLPPRYQDEDQLDYQRRIHSVLIERGLEIISLEYMKGLSEKCAGEKIPLREVLKDGKNADILIEATRSHDLFIMGAQGLGTVEGTRTLGGTASSVLRHAGCDLLIIRNDRIPRKVLVGIDGSEESFGAVKTGSGLASMMNGEVTLISVFNPQLHRTVFSLLSRVLSEEAGKVFRFNEQETLHNTIIDRSLAELYRKYLDRGCEVARDSGCSRVNPVRKEGVPWNEICREAEQGGYDLVVVSRSGMHKGSYSDIGSTAERVVRNTGANVLVVGGWAQIPGKIPSGEPASVPCPAGGSLEWTEEASARIENVPPFARSMAVLAIERYARELGVFIITPEIMDGAREKFGI